MSGIQGKLRKRSKLESLMAERALAQAATNMAVLDLNCAIQILVELTGKDKQYIMDLISKRRVNYVQ